MANTLKLLTQDVSHTTASTVYTVPANTTTVIKEIFFCNLTANGVSITVSLVQSGDTAGDKNTIIKNLPLIGYETQIFGLSTFLSAGTIIQLLSDIEGAVSINISGVEIS